VAGRIREGERGREGHAAAGAKGRFREGDRVPAAGAHPGGGGGRPDGRPDPVAAGGAGRGQQKTEGPVQEPSKVRPIKLRFRLSHPLKPRGEKSVPRFRRPPVGPS
jgi:hypothetical protein